jgi:Domain of unknown function (DUF4394)
MKTRIKRGIAAAVAVMATSTAVFLGNISGAAATAPTLPAFGLISNGATMCAFNTDKPGTLNWVRDITGFVDGETTLIGIDARVQDGLLYGVGNTGNIYTITINPDPSWEVVDLAKVSKLGVPLSGTNFDIDFNPAADRLRVISDTGQNLRHNLNDHTTIADMPLTLNGAPATGVTAAAYTNNDLSPDTVTTLVDLDTLNDQVSLQAPANNGTQNPTGKLTVNATANAGADIYANVSGGKTISNTAFAAFVPSGVTRASFYMFDIFTGAAVKVGDFPSIAPVVDVAVDLDRS